MDFVHIEIIFENIKILLLFTDIYINHRDRLRIQCLKKSMYIYFFNIRLKKNDVLRLFDKINFINTSI